MKCGVCNQPPENHPHPFCPFIHEPIADAAGRVVGYMLKDKPQDAHAEAEI